jgi:hypothetical protein
MSIPCQRASDLQNKLSWHFRAVRFVTRTSVAMLVAYFSLQSQLPYRAELRNSGYRQSECRKIWIFDNPSITDNTDKSDNPYFLDKLDNSANSVNPDSSVIQVYSDNHDFSDNPDIAIIRVIRKCSDPDNPDI